MSQEMVGFFKNKRTDRVWGVEILDENMEPEMGPVYFSFDRKVIYNYWIDYKKLSDEQKWLFDDAFPFWAKYKASKEEAKRLKKEHPNWKLPDDPEGADVECDLVDVTFFSELPPNDPE